MCIYIYIYTQIYTKIFIYTALFQNALSADPKIVLAMRMPSSEIIMWKRGLQKYVHMYTHMKSSFPKRVKRHSKKWVSNVNAKFRDRIINM